jgi:hypothetical protein
MRRKARLRIALGRVRVRRTFGVAERSLALTLPEQPTELDDGLLTASEVAHLKLNADWVLLWACYTAAPISPAICLDHPGARYEPGKNRFEYLPGYPTLFEMPQIRRRLSLAHRHQ